VLAPVLIVSCGVPGQPQVLDRVLGALLALARLLGLVRFPHTILAHIFG